MVDPLTHDDGISNEKAQCRPMGCSQFSYQARNETNGFEAGDMMRLDASLQLWSPCVVEDSAVMSEEGMGYEHRR